MTISAEAVVLANRGYRVTIQRDSSGNGDPYYAAATPEFPFALGTGESTAEAKADLLEAVASIIQTLIDDGLPVPEPVPLTAVVVKDPRSSRVGFHDLQGNWLPHAPTPKISTPLVAVGS